MSELVVQQIYDQLYSLESKVKKDHVYPIHKKLVFDGENEIRDIYGWMAMKLDFKDGEKVMDAGCGVGFGSCLMAKAHHIDVTGISLSEKEVEKANQFAKISGLSERVNFKKQSFDELSENSYDKIIAIESIKHSLNLSKTLQVFVDALVPGGTLYIVEDFYNKEKLSSDAHGYKNDWNLVDVFRLSDFYEVLEEENTSYQDLTKYMPTKSKFLVNLKLMFNSLFNNLRSDKEMNLNKIFRGGYYLDRMYLKGTMKYGVLKYAK